MPLNSHNPYFVGLDIGGTNIKFSVLDRDLKAVLRGSKPSLANVNHEQVVEVAKTILEELTHEGVSFSSFGVGCAGSVDRANGVVRTSPNFRGWRDVPLAKLLSQVSGKTAVIENDANCAAWGEWMAGAKFRAKSLMAITLGTGIGGGIIFENKIFRGATSTGPELGHVSLDFRGPQCGCGNVGCFEYFCSGTAIQRETGLEARTFFERVGRNPDLVKFQREFIFRLGIGLASLANAFDPDLILLAGGVAQGLKDQLTEIAAIAKKHCFPSIAGSLQIDLAKLDEFSGAFGAALLSEEPR